MSKLQLGLGSLILFLATAVLTMIAVVTSPLMLVINPFKTAEGMAVIDHILLATAWLTPVVIGAAALAGLAGLIFLFIDREKTWRLAAGGGAVAIPHGVFWTFTVATSNITSSFGGMMYSGTIEQAPVVGLAVMLIGMPLAMIVGSFFINASLVKEDKEIWDAKEKYTRGMNIMDPSVQKELEEARKKHQEKQNQ